MSIKTKAEFATVARTETILTIEHMPWGLARTPEFHSDGDNYDAWQLGQAGFRTDSKLTDRDTLTVQGDLYKGNVGQQVAIGSYSPPGQLNSKRNARCIGR